MSVGFFTRQLNSVVKPIAKPVSEPAFVNVGGIGDPGFRAVAACLIDDYVFKRNLTNHQVIEKVMTIYFEKYPQAQSIGRTTRDRLENMIRSPLAMAECTRRFADILRQFTVTELRAHPEKYRGTYASLDIGDENEWSYQNETDARRNYLDR